LNCFVERRFHTNTPNYNKTTSRYYIAAVHKEQYSKAIIGKDIKQGNFEINCYARPVTYLMEYAALSHLRHGKSRRYPNGALSLSLIALIGLVTLTFDLLTFK